VRTAAQAGGSGVGDPDEAVRIAEREWTQQQRIHHAEYRGVGSNPEREYQDGHDRVPGVAGHAADRVMNVVTKRLDGHGTLDGRHGSRVDAEAIFRVPSAMPVASGDAGIVAPSDQT